MPDGLSETIAVQAQQNHLPNARHCQKRRQKHCQRLTTNWACNYAFCYNITAKHLTELGGKKLLLRAAAALSICMNKRHEVDLKKKNQKRL